MCNASSLFFLHSHVFRLRACESVRDEEMCHCDIASMEKSVKENGMCLSLLSSSGARNMTHLSCLIKKEMQNYGIIRYTMHKDIPIHYIFIN